MAYYLCQNKPVVTNTALWTNGNPSSDQGATSVTLSQSMANFDYLEVLWKFNTSSTYYYKAYISTSEFRNGTYGSIPAGRFVVGYIGESYRYARWLSRNSDTSVGISTCFRCTSSASTTKNDNIIIYQIRGIKYAT